MTAVEVAHLVKRYRAAHSNAVDDVSFDVPEGQLFCLLGPNGAGKTTTVSILTTTLAPTSGRVRVVGRNLATEQAGVRREIGIVFQQPSLDVNRREMRTSGRTRCSTGSNRGIRGTAVCRAGLRR